MRRRSTLQLIAVCCIAVLCGLGSSRTASAQPITRDSSAWLSGEVVEAGTGGFPIPNASVSIQNTAHETTTDELGTFALRNLPQGPLTLYVRAPNCPQVTLTVPVAQRSTPLSVALSCNTADEETFSVTVVDAHTRTETASTTRLTPREMAAAPRRNAEDLLRQVPGFTLVQHGSEGKGHQFFLRGFDAVHGADLEITLDGLLINEWSNVHAQGYLDLAMILPELVESVVVTKGPFTLEQGAFAMAGSADYRLGVAPQDRGVRASYTVGTTARERLFASYSPHDGDGREFIGVELIRDDGYGQNRSIQRAGANSRLNLFDTPSTGRLDLLTLGSYADFELPGTLRNDDVRAGRVDFYDAYDPLSEGQSARGLLSLFYTRPTKSSQTSVTAHVGYRKLDLLENFTGFLINPVDGDRRDQFQETVSFGLLSTHNTTLTNDIALRTGLGVRGDLFTQREDNVGRALERISTRRDLHGLQMVTHGFAGLHWAPLDSLQCDVGARFDLLSLDVSDELLQEEGTGTLFVASPRVSARWVAAESLRIFTAYGRGLRPPEARAFTGFDAGRAGISDEVFSGGSPSMTVSDALEVGMRWDPSMWFGVSASAFGTWIERESLFDHVSGTSLELNGTQRLGGEVVMYSDPLSWLSLRADATFVDATFVESGNRVPSVPWLVAGARAIATHESGLQGGLRLLTVAPRPLPHGARGALLVMSDATFGYVHRWFRLHLEIENVLNRALREGEYHYASNWSAGDPASVLPVLHTTAGAPLNARLTLGATF